jgi:hypothetical protein
MAEGLTPLTYMLQVLRDETQDHARRDDMAKAAAPYVHPRLSSIEARAKVEVDATVINDRDRAKAVAALVAKARKT